MAGITNIDFDETQAPPYSAAYRLTKFGKPV